MMPHEKLVLRGACTALDKIALLEAELQGASLTGRGSMGQEVANPLLGELRAQQAAFDRAVKQLDLPEEGERAGRSAVNRSTSARDAANARWGLQ
ncbi:hypothetical protein [Leucobacter chromiireducens]|uniref:hypothetical protein n=1 Tax=Leucobacter chromiireducens TaxID=283877 RepID=UPI000F6375EF|nr:hypothetical protein [Leucobacter chromiireducens]